MAYCDFCTCRMCQTGCSETSDSDGSNVKASELPIFHAQTVDGRWICDTCYRYECCVRAGSDPCSGLCEENKCEHRPKLIDGKWVP